MQIGFLKTDGGPHSAESWAMATADMLVSVPAGSSSEVEAQARKLRGKIVDVLERHHGDVARAETEGLAAQGDARLAEPIDHSDKAADVVSELRNLARGTRWEQAVDAPGFVLAAHDLVRGHLEENARIHRSWHVDRNASR